MTSKTPTPDAPAPRVKVARLYPDTAKIAVFGRLDVGTPDESMRFVGLFDDYGHEAAVAFARQLAVATDGETYEKYATVSTKFIFGTV